MPLPSFPKYFIQITETQRDDNDDNIRAAAFPFCCKHTQPFKGVIPYSLTQAQIDFKPLSFILTKSTSNF